MLYVNVKTLYGTQTDYTTGGHAGPMLLIIEAHMLSFLKISADPIKVPQEHLFNAMVHTKRDHIYISMQQSQHPFTHPSKPLSQFTNYQCKTLHTPHTKGQ